MVIGIVWASVWLLGIAVASVVTALRGYTAVYGGMLGVMSVAIPLPVVGPVLAVLAAERWTREPPRVPMHPIRWPATQPA